jgi:MFS family permease
LNEATKITPARMAILGVGWFGAQVFWAFHAGSMPLFLKNFTDSKFTIALVLSLAGITGLIVPPSVGYLSDRTFTRFGRRTPYIIFGILGALICVLSLPHAAALSSIGLISGLMYFLFRTAETPYLCLLPDITPPQQRSTASGIMNLVGSIGLISFFAVSALIWDEHPNAVFFIVAAVISSSILIAIALIREPQVPHETAPETVNPLAYLRGLGREINVLKFFAAQFCWWLAFWMVSTFAVLFVVQELNVAEGRSFLVLMVFAIVATLAMLPIGMLGDRLGRKGILSCMLAFWALTQILLGLSQNFTHVLITLGLSAIPYAAILAVGYAFLLDLIPEERTAEFVGISTLSMAAAQICGPMIGGQLIDMLGYRSIFPCAAGFLVIGLALLQFVRPRGGTEPSAGS